MAFEAVKESNNYVSSEKSGFWAMEMEEDACQCWIAGWTNSATKAWELASDIRTGIAIKFQSNGIRAQRLNIDMSPQPIKS